MRAGHLRFRVTIQEAIETRDSVGAVVQYWQDRATVWAAIEPLRGEEAFSLQQVKPSVSTKVKLRSLNWLSPKMRLRHGDRILDIDSIIDWQSRRVFQEVFCKEAA